MNAERIGEIKAASNLSDLVEDFGIKLKAGRGKCPFHEGKGKSATLSIDNSKQTYHCFSCAASGDVVEFVRQSQQIGFVEAMKFLGNRAGISTEVSITKAAGNKPKAAAKMYLETERKLSVPANWYEQETFGYGNKHSATVRFYLADGVYWERFVDGHLFERNFNIKGKYKGLGWQPPGQKIKKGDVVYITEAIFDAISLTQLGKKVLCGLSCGNLPSNIISKHLNASWVIAFDGDAPGRAAATKQADAIIKMGAKCEIIDPPTNTDWNDLHRAGKLNDELLQAAWWRGQILGAKSARERMGWFILRGYKSVKNPISFGAISKMTITHANAYYHCELLDDTSVKTFNESLEKSEIKAVEFLAANIRQSQISNCTADFLYSEVDVMTEEVGYYFRVQFSNGAKTTQTKFSAGAITDQNQFNKALLSRAVGAVFDGGIGDFRLLRQKWFKNQAKHIRTVPYLGYDKDTGAYLFADFGYHNGRHIKANKLDYLTFNGKHAKSTFKQWQPPKPLDQADWFDDFNLVGGNNGITGLAFWLMSLFAVQVRDLHVSVPFWEFTGIAGSGKSTVLDFLWKLVGLEHHEGRDPNKMTKAGLGRMFMQLSNMPVVVLEGDRDNSSHRAGFDLNHIKTLYAGQNPYGRALFNRGVEIDEPPFFGTVVVSQNHLIEGEEQILSRFVQTVAVKGHFTAESVQAAQRLEQLRHYEVVGFLHKALGFEPKIMETYLRVYPKLLDRLTNSDSYIDGRIAKNHAQIMAFGKCLQLVVPKFNDLAYKNWCEFMLERAISRQRDINADHPIVQKFWDIYDTYDEKIINENSTVAYSESNLNHSNGNEIAINLNHFKELAERHHQQIDMDAVRKLLADSKRHKFLKTKKVNSQILHKVVHCWIFKGDK